MQVVDVYARAGQVVAEVVGLANRDASFDTAAGEPDREAAWMMVAAEVAAKVPLTVGCSAELTTQGQRISILV